MQRRICQAKVSPKTKNNRKGALLLHFCHSQSLQNAVVWGRGEGLDPYLMHLDQGRKKVMQAAKLRNTLFPPTLVTIISILNTTFGVTRNSNL